MEHSKVITLINNVSDYYKNEDIPLAVRKKLWNILDDIYIHADYITTESLAIIFDEHKGLKTTKNIIIYWEIMHKLLDDFDFDLYYSVYNLAQEDNDIALDPIDLESNKVTYWEIISIKNYINLNQYLINTNVQTIPSSHMMLLDFYHFCLDSSRLKDILSYRCYENSILQKIIKTMEILYKSNIWLVWDNIFTTTWYWFDYCIPKQRFYDIIKEIISLQLKSTPDDIKSKLNQRLLYTNANFIIKEFDLYMHKTMQQRIPQKETTTYYA